MMDEDQVNMRAMKSEEEEDVRKLVEMTQKEEEEQEEQRGRVAPNMGAGGHTTRPCRTRKEKKRKDFEG